MDDSDTHGVTRLQVPDAPMYLAQNTATNALSNVKILQNCSSPADSGGSSGGGGSSSTTTTSSDSGSGSGSSNTGVIVGVVCGVVGAFGAFHW